MSDPTPTLHPAQNRGLRELYATARSLADHWEWLAPRFEDPESRQAMLNGAGRARALLHELPSLTEEHNLYVGVAAGQAGASLSTLRTGLGDRFLEVNQALRAALLDVQHVVTLLGYQAQLAQANGNPDVDEFCRRWERELAAVERATRRAAARLGRGPDAAIAPLDDSPAGRAAHGAAYWAGTVGEWFDRLRGERDE
jgi:hypothetical protein